MVTFDPHFPTVAPLVALEELSAAARAAAGDPVAALGVAVELGRVLPGPGRGRTPELWQTLAELAAIDLTVARAVEPHLDALSILEQAGDCMGQESAPSGDTWGVFAAEGPGTRLEASGADDAIRLNGRKPWCSLGQLLDRALVTAWTSPHSRRLFSVDLHHEGVGTGEGRWSARGLAGVVSLPIDFEDVPAIPVGLDGWYLARPGFTWGGMGVAAIWFGGAAGLVRTMFAAASRREPDQVARMLLGQADATLHAAAATLGAAARGVDAGRMQGPQAWAAAVRVRHVVHDACEAVLRCAAHGLGPGPLTGDEDHARRVSDLEVYLRQHAPERDAAVIGGALLQGLDATWL